MDGEVVTIHDYIIRGAAVLVLAFMVGAGFHDLHRIADALETLADRNTPTNTPDTEPTP